MGRRTTGRGGGVRAPSRRATVGRDSPTPFGKPATLCLLLLALAAAALSNTGPIADNDYGLHLRLGQEIAETGRPPSLDNHSFTAPGAHYPDHEWLPQLLFYQIHRLIDDGGMVVLKGLLVGVALTLIVLAVPGPLVLRLGLVVLTLLLGLNHSQMRPHLLGWVMAGLLVLLAERRRPAGVILLLLLWGNCHGSVLLGAGIAALYFAEESWQRRSYRPLVWAVSSVLAPMVNPNGLHSYLLFFEIRGHTGFVGEWQPYLPNTFPFWLDVLLVSLALYGLYKTRPFSWFDLARVLVLGFLAFQASRNGIMAAIFLAPLLGRWYAGRISRWSVLAQRLVAGLLVLALATVLGIRIYLGQTLRFELDHEQLPVAAVRFIQEHGLTGPMFNDYNFGGYLLWKAWPDHPVFVDGRLEVYDGVLDEYLQVSNARPGWQEIVERYGVAFFVVRPERAIAQALVEQEGWDLLYFDYNSVIYCRQDLFPLLPRLQVVSPYGHRDRSRVDEAISEIRYLLDENPLFFGGYKILAFLLYRRGDFPGATNALLRYLELHPQGMCLEETRSLVEALRRHGVWPRR